MPVEAPVVLQDLRAPFDDLLSLLERRPAPRILDLTPAGSERTTELRDMLGAAEVAALDLSRPGAEIPAGGFDLVVSSSTLRVGGDHRAVLTRATAALNRGGQLALQLPASGGHPANTIAAAVARQFGLDPRPLDVLSLDDYAEALHELGYQRQHVRLQVYGRLLPSTADVFDCVRDTILAAYEPSLPAPTFERFLRAYRDELRDGIRHASPYFYADKRLLIWGSL